MTEEWTRYLENREREEYKRGYRAGANSAGVTELERRIQVLENVLLEFIGYEDEWLLTKASLRNRKIEELVDMVTNQR